MDDERPTPVRAPGPARLLVVGSCVSRDTFAHLDPDAYQLVGYVARQSLASAFAGPSEPVVDPGRLSSRFQRRVLRDDAEASLPGTVWDVADTVDLLVWDLVDERLGLHRHPDGGLTTDSVEVRSVLGTTVPAGMVHIGFGSAEHLRLFVAALGRWRGLLEETGLLGRTVLLAPPWATTTVEGSPVPSSWGLGAAEGNALTEPYVAAVEHELGVPVIGRDGPPPLSTSVHRWGPAPFHYDDATYLRLAGALVAEVRRVLGPAAPAGRGTRVPPADAWPTESPARAPSPAVTLAASGSSLVASVDAAGAKAWTVHLYRGSERVATTTWTSDPRVEFEAPDPGVYRVRLHLLGRSGDRSVTTSAVVRVTGR